VMADLALWKKYQDVDHLTSIKDMILKATPRSDNPNVDSYIADVARMLGKDPNDSVDLTNEDEAAKWLKAIAKNEGHPIEGYDHEGSLHAGIKKFLGTDNQPGMLDNLWEWGKRHIYIGSQDQGEALANAQKHLGENSSQINSFLKDNGQQINAAQQAWCAAFVNGALKSVGIIGTGSNVATSFANWGKHVGLEDLKKGDVLVESHGHAPGDIGGHVGLATGNSRMVGGRREIEMTSGNYGGKVANSWEDANDVEVRRQVKKKLGLWSNTSPDDAQAPADAPPTPDHHKISFNPLRNVPARIYVYNNTGGNAHITASTLAV